MIPTLPLFIWPGSRHAPNICRVMRSKRFLSHLILALSWCLKNKIRSQWETFAPSYNAFFLLCNSGRKVATHSMQPLRRARTRSCSGSLNLVPDSNASELPPSTSRADPREDPKRSPPLIPDAVPSGTEKGHWTQEGCEGLYSIRGQTALRPSAYVDFQV